ncbi:hypothetical protein HY771_02750 [Candidatus Uhrbacteria bacterium]|nr:hypothetical protein [Candidatus Uhrbacteria bacterium]
MPEKRFVPVHVSLSDALKGPMGHRELNLGTSALPDEIEFVMVPHLGIRIPAVVGLRTVLRDKCDGIFVHHDKWQVTISPNDDQLLRRLLGREKGELQEGEGSVRYDAVDALRAAHVQLSSLAPPCFTSLQICFAFNRRGTPTVEWKTSSIDYDVRERARILLANEVIRAGWLFGKPKFLGIRIGKDELPVPEVPKDEWLTQNRHGIEEVVFNSFVPVLQSLWRAEFAEGSQAVQLSRAGYALEAIGRTQIGTESLHELVDDRRARLTSLTYLGDTDDSDDPKIHEV